MHKKLGPRKTLYWPLEWSDVWEHMRIVAVKQKKSVSKLVYERFKKGMEKKKR